PRVWRASQTSAAMMISGKSALRKKRFTRPRFGGYLTPAQLTLIRGPWLRPFRGNQGRIEHPDVRQIPVALGEVEPVADHEPVRDLEADVADRHLDLAPL